MTIKELALSAATCIVILGAAIASNAVLNRLLPIASGEIAVATPGAGACVDARGAWVNWPWANVPALSPPCPPDSTGPAPQK